MLDTANQLDDLPDSVTGIALERALRRNIIAGCLGAAFFSLISGIYLTSFGRMIGLTKFQFGLLGAVPMIVFPARLYSSVLVERIGRRKNYWTALLVSSRAVWLLVLMIPFLPLANWPDLRAAVFLGLLLISNMLLVMSAPVWLSWMGDLVPESRRGQFWARRNAITSAAPVIPLFFFYLMFDYLQGAGYEPLGYVIIWGFAVAVGEIDLWIHYKIPEPKMARVRGRPNLKGMLAEPLRDRNFRPFLIYVGATTFSAMFLGHFPNLYLLDTFKDVTVTVPLGFASFTLQRYGLIAAIGGVSVAMALALSRTWGFLIDRFGNKPVLRLVTLIWVPVPLLWLFVTPEHPFAATLAIYLLGGMIWTARDYMVLNLLYATTPRANRTMYAAVHGVAFGLFGALAPTLSGWLMELMGDFHADIAGVHIVSFHILCIITVGVRFIEQGILTGVREPKSASTISVVRRLLQANPFAVLPRAFELASSVTAVQRAKVARELGDTGSHLVTRELIESLDDPNPEVRHQAALSLGQTKDATAVAPLIARLNSVDAEMRRQAAWALGQIGSPQATRSLIALLSDPYLLVCSAAALALGNIGDEAAVPELMKLLRPDADPLTFGSAATALGLLGRAHAMEPILHQMRRTDQPVYRRQLAVAVGDLIGPRHTFYTYLDAETKVPGQRATGSCRALQRALDKLDAPRYEAADLDGAIERLEADYLAGNWADCARGLAELPQRLLAAGICRWVDLGLAGKYLKWLADHSGPETPGPAFEDCALGMFAIEQLAARLDGIIQP